MGNSFESWKIVSKVLGKVMGFFKGNFVDAQKQGKLYILNTFCALLSSFSTTVNRDLSGFTDLIPCFFF